MSDKVECERPVEGHMSLCHNDPVVQWLRHVTEGDLRTLCLEAMTEWDDYDALDVIYQVCDEAFTDGRFQEVDGILQELHPTSILRSLAFLSITRGVKEKLPSRADFYDRVSEFIMSVDPDRHDDLLVGLK